MGEAAKNKCTGQLVKKKKTGNTCGMGLESWKKGLSQQSRPKSSRSTDRRKCLVTARTKSLGEYVEHPEFLCATKSEPMILKQRCAK